MLSPRRFPDTFTRRREEGGEFDDSGEWVSGPVTETVLRGSLQPLTAEDILESGGNRLVNRHKLFVPLPDALRTSDCVVLDDGVYVVEEVMSWRGHHTRAIVLRET